LIENMHRARVDGLDVAGDQYPYSQSSGSLSMSMFPRWAQVGGRSATLDRINDADQRQRVAAETEQAITNFGGPDRLRLTSFTPDRTLEGTSIADIADSWDATVGEAALRLFEQSEVGIRNHSMSDDDVDVIGSSELIAVASDGNSLRDEGPLSSDQTHPRSYGTNARFIETMALGKGLVSIEEAVRKMSGLPAQRMGLERRGRIAPGFFADLVIFNPNDVRENTTFEDPHRYTTGIDHVLVNGSFAMRDGKPTGANPGRVIRDKQS
jgi:N-acyl-D-amino-acid deacylase